MAKVSGLPWLCASFAIRPPGRLFHIHFPLSDKDGCRGFIEFMAKQEPGLFKPPGSMTEEQVEEFRRGWQGAA
jgi:hypothetical protein